MDLRRVSWINRLRDLKVQEEIIHSILEIIYSQEIFFMAFSISGAPKYLVRMDPFWNPIIWVIWF